MLNDALFTEEYDEMVVVKDIDFYSLCVPGRQIVNAVGGARRACNVNPGDRLWTLDRGYMKETVVTRVTSRKTREIVEVRTARGTFRAHPGSSLDDRLGLAGGSAAHAGGQGGVDQPQITLSATP